MKLPRGAVVLLLLGGAVLAFRPFDSVDPGGLVNSAVVLGLLLVALGLVIWARRS